MLLEEGGDIQAQEHYAEVGSLAEDWWKGVFGIKTIQGPSGLAGFL